MSRVFGGLALVIAISYSGISGQVVSGSIIQYKTIPGGDVSGDPVNAWATFTTSLNTITVKLENFQADPNSPKQVLYDILFNVSTGQNSGTITSTTGVERTINGDGTYSDTGVMNSVDWGLFTNGANLHLDRIAAPGQKHHGIVGPPNAGTNKYDAGGGALTGTSHNPFWGGSAEFVLNVPGVTASSTIAALSFSFNTTSGGKNDVEAVLVPEPQALFLASLGFAALVCRRVRRR